MTTSVLILAHDHKVAVDILHPDQAGVMHVDGTEFVEPFQHRLFNIFHGQDIYVREIDHE